MAWKKNCGLLIGCIAMAHVVGICTMPVDPLAKEAEWCNGFVQFVERSEFRVFARVNIEGPEYSHALASALIAHISEKSIHCRSLTQRMRIAISLYNLKLLKEQLDLKVFQQASALYHNWYGAFHFISKASRIGRCKA